jgi:hypothetical protein
MEWSDVEVKRKFEGSLLPIDYFEKETSPPVRFFAQVLGVHREPGATQVSFYLPDKDTSLYGHLPTFQTPGIRYPLLKLHYWLPKTGYYKLKKKNDWVFVCRRLRKSYFVGYNGDSYTVTRLGDTSFTVNHIDFTSHTPTILHKNKILFQGKTIGLVEKDAVFLDEPQYANFLPSDIVEKWKNLSASY